MNTRFLALVLAFSFVVVGCVSRSPAQPKPTETLKLPPSLADRRVVPGKGDCAPSAHPDSAFADCCDARPCAGYCVLNTKMESVSCECFGQLHGCPAGLVCCKEKGGCVTPKECAEAQAE